MIRGKKNFIPQTALVFGFGILYKLEEESVARHKNDRIVKTKEEDLVEVAREMAAETANEDDVEVELAKDDDSESDNSQSETEQAEENNETDDKSLFPDTTLQIKLISNIK